MPIRLLFIESFGFGNWNLHISWSKSKHNPISSNLAQIFGLINNDYSIYFPSLNHLLIYYTNYKILIS